MLLLKLIQSLIKTLHSEGTPGQVAAGLALGAILGLTPLWNLHNAVVLALIMVLNVSFLGAMMGWALSVPVGFLLDPAFDWIGRTLLLDTPALRPLWTALYNAPVVPLTNFNNTVVLGSLAVPQLAVSSNLDRALAERVRAVAGGELAAAERRVRAQVDSLVDPQVAPVVAQVTALGGDATRRLGGQRAQLDDARKALEQRLRELTRLPGVRLP